MYNTLVQVIYLDFYDSNGFYYLYFVNFTLPHFKTPFPMVFCIIISIIILLISYLLSNYWMNEYFGIPYIKIY